MKINFTKMHGLGNDFVVIDNRDNSIALTPNQIKFIADRNRGVGFNQLLIIEPSTQADILMRVYNSDASQAGGCGNGARCVAKFIFDKDGTKDISMETTTTIWHSTYIKENIFQINMGKPKTHWQDIPLAKEADTSKLDLGIDMSATCINVGNPHAVFFVKDLNTTNVEQLGAYVENHPMFPQKTNVEFAQIIDEKTIRMRVWERGEGITQACGTGASATLVAAVINGLIKKEATIILDGGNLNIKLEDDTLLMSGEATTVFEGFISLQ